MPGIFGLADSDPIADIGSRLCAMAAQMRHHAWYGEESYCDASAAVGLGRLRLDFHPGDLEPTTAEGMSLVTLVDGEIYDASEQRRALRAGGHMVSDNSLGALISAGYLAQGQSFFRGLHGKFAAVLWDRRRQHLMLVNDRFGMRPLYYTHVGGRFLFASEIKGLLVDPGVSRKSNLRGIAQFFTFGQLLGEDTLLEGVRVLPAAGFLTYDVRNARISLDRYWKLEAAAPVKPASEQAVLDRLDHAFANAVGRFTAGNDHLGLSLSGGLDSRTILGAMAEDRPVTTVCVGVPGGADHDSAAKMARLTHRHHHPCYLSDRFLERFEEHLEDMVRLTDGHYLSQCIVMPTLPVYRQLGIQVLLRGHGGELMHMRKAYNYSLDASAVDSRDAASLEDWLFRHLQAYLLDGTEGRLFAAPYRRQIEDLARESLRACWQQSEGTQPPVHRIWHLFLSQRSRRETAMSLVKFGSLVETRLPYLDNELIDALFAAPPEMKLDEKIQAHILRQRQPAFLGVTNVNTGARVDAGSVSRLLGKVRQKVLAKLGVRGYQPYERLGLWLRRELRPCVQKLLLSERCLSRGIFDPEALKKVVEDHFEGKNHTFLLLALMTFEMGQRQIVEGTEPLANAQPASPRLCAPAAEVSSN